MNRSDKLWAALFVVFWSSGFVGAELGTRHASALQLLTWRFIVLALPAAAWLWWRRRRFRAGDVAVHAVVGLLGQVLYLTGVVAAAEQGVAAGTNALIASLQPVVTAIAAYFILAQPVGRLQVLGLAVGFGGVAIVVGGDYSAGGAPLWAFALPLGGMLSLVAATLLERRTRPASLSPVDAIAVQFTVAALGFTSAATLLGELAPPMTPAFWGSVAWVVLPAAIGGYGTYWVVVHRNGPTAVGTLLYLTPPVSALWAWAMFGETVPVATWIGLGVTGIGVVLALRHAPPQVQADRSETVPEPEPATAGR
ncbi:DMT family transporter [Salininema proteolyticum]|uniref:DMT family transporter n=1 Tax=Salininema proteolyticum TaxID=1607685 RepID=A0ABV8U2J8_9ACTN